MLHSLATLLLSILLGWAIITNSSNNNYIETYATAADKRLTISTPFKSATSNDILAKILVDYAIQALQDGDRNSSIKYLLAADRELINGSGLSNSTYDVEPRYIVEYLVQLMQNEAGLGITNNKAFVYLNLVDSQLGDNLNEPNANSALGRHSLVSYVNQRYGIRVQYPYYWSIDGTSYPTGKIGTQIVSFFLPSASIDLPVISIGIDNLTQSLRHRSVSISEYLNLSLSHKNSTGFPGFKLLEGNMSNHNTVVNNSNNNNKLFGQSKIYTIVWVYTHPTYGLRKSIEFGAVTVGSKGFFVDYTSSATKFLKYLPVAKNILSSFENSIPSK